MYLMRINHNKKQWHIIQGLNEKLTIYSRHVTNKQKNIQIATKLKYL